LKPYNYFFEGFAIPKIGSEILVGKFKNKKAIVKGFGKDKNNQPTIITDKGEFSLYKFRIAKLMPKKKR
jgi:hypothetical protein